MHSSSDSNHLTEGARLCEIGKTVEEHFKANKRVLTYAEYLGLVSSDPRRHARGTAQYLQDMFDHYGTEEVSHPKGKVRHFKLFDVPWDDGEAGLVGQEEVQNAIYRVLCNFVRQRRIDRLILLHGPNGSSKSTVTEMLQRAMEHYSTLDEGVLYRFNWMFPSRTPGRKGIGFHRGAVDSVGSYARLEESEIDARLPCELRDHPLLLVPKAERLRLLDSLLRRMPGAKVATDDAIDELQIADYIAHGDLCHRCKLIYEALLSAYDGDYLQVLRHVQVERFYVSRRYRVSAGRVEPQLAVDARARQITADRSITALPAALQNSALHETSGEVVDANRGVLDFADLLKRPPEAYKYLLTTVESGRVVLDAVNLFVDLLFIGSANENRLNAFMESPEWTSFKARIELIRVPYMRDHRKERGIYEMQVTPAQLGKHMAPHAIPVATLWAMLTRMHRPDPARYGDRLGPLVAELTPLAKAEYYAGRTPAGLDEDAVKLLRAAREKIYGETVQSLMYEGRTGASPREIKAVLLNAAQDPAYGCVTAEAVLKQIEGLVQETSVYSFLRQEKQELGYFDHPGLIETTREWYLQLADDEVRSAMGLVEERRYVELFGRYITQVTHHVRKEQLLNPVTGNYEQPDAGLMQEVESSLGVSGDVESFRQGVMTKIGAWSVDHQGQRPNHEEIFPEQIETMRQAYYRQQRQRVKRILDDALRVLADEASALTDDEHRVVAGMIDELKQRYGYCDVCVREVLMTLARRRYAD